MNLIQYLKENKSAIVKSWHEAALEFSGGCPHDFADKQKELVVEATGCTPEGGLEGLLDALLNGVMRDDVSRFLDGMMRSRVANELSASQALEFILKVKKIVRIKLGRDSFDDALLAEELAVWESAVDDLALFGFDLYAKIREADFEFKANEAKKEVIMLLKKAKLIDDLE